MSWDASLMIDTGGEYPAGVAELGNYTYNVAPMYFEVFPEEKGFRDSLDGVLASDAIPILEQAITALEADPAHFKAMEPENKWGNYEGAVEYLKTILAGCQEHPKATIHIW
jgi:hypothetical protein